MSAERPFRLSARLIAGLVIMALGALFLLDNLRVLYADDVLRFAWPGLLLAIGLFKLIARGGWIHRLLGLGFTLAGTWVLLDELNVGFYGYRPEDFWPLALVGVGLALVIGAFRPAHAGRRELGEPTVNAFALMAGNGLASTSRGFRGGNLAAVMGGCELDLRNAELAPEGAEIDAFAFWGGVEILVPQGWSVASKVVPVMGAYEDTTRPAEVDPGRQLTVKGFAVMGAIEVSNGPDGEA